MYILDWAWLEFKQHILAFGQHSSHPGTRHVQYGNAKSRHDASSQEHHLEAYKYPVRGQSGGANVTCLAPYRQNKVVGHLGWYASRPCRSISISLRLECMLHPPLYYISKILDQPSSHKRATVETLEPCCMQAGLACRVMARLTNLCDDVPSQPDHVRQTA
jgi:hypothetical protein